MVLGGCRSFLVLVTTIQDGVQKEPRGEIEFIEPFRTLILQNNVVKKTPLESKYIFN